MSKLRSVQILHAANLKCRKMLVDKLHEELPKIADCKITIVSQHDIAEIDDAVVKSIISSDANGIFHPSQVSNILKHVAALKRVSADDDDSSVHLILEDDSLYSNNMPTLFKTCMEKLPQDWDMVYLGIPFSTSPLTPGAGLQFSKVESLFQIVPCCDSYLVHPRSARTILKQVVPCTAPMNVQFSNVVKSGKIACYFTTPNVFIDGSKVGLYISSITPFNRLMYNAKYLELESKPASERTEDALESADFRDHPDFEIMIAKSLSERKLHSDAVKHYERAYRAFVTDNPLNVMLARQSPFMKSYISEIGMSSV